MTDAALSRTIRIRFYQDSVRDMGRTFRLPAHADMRSVLKQSALAAVPKKEGWTLQLFTLERTKQEERVAALLDRLARREMGGPDFAAAMAMALDGSCAVLAMAARDKERIQRVRSALSPANR
ncbi:hypothetical protein ACFOD4_03745 [Pseudoroseomonas globiformis]|uniref:Uncharacterized protein n=1 Tax=Teichococcus globiformis TaxID=2307229 RepID=A0ABV7FZH9_9PROT